MIDLQPSRSQTFQLGLIGYPLDHSLSPRIHQAAMRACKLSGEYLLYPIHPDDKQGLVDLLAKMRKGGITGLNVTIPHKQNVIQFLDELTLTARSIGAVNTVFLQDGRLAGDNTDAAGFLLDLKRFFNGDGHNRKEKEALVLGAGGSARAVVYALLNDGWQVSLAARRLEQAQNLAGSYKNYHIPIINLYNHPNNLLSQTSSLTLIVNTTPLGMSPNTDQSPWPENLPLPPHAAIYDLVYNPRQTRLVTIARAQGLSAATGLGMLVEQAASSFKIWTGCDPSRESMFGSVQQSVSDH